MNLKYVKVTKDNFLIAYNIQKFIWPNEPDYNHFIDKASNYKENNICWIVYSNDNPIGISGIYVEDIDNESLWLDWYGVLPKYRKKDLVNKFFLIQLNIVKN